MGYPRSLCTYDPELKSGFYDTSILLYCSIAVQYLQIVICVLFYYCETMRKKVTIVNDSCRLQTSFWTKRYTLVILVKITVIIFLSHAITVFEIMKGFFLNLSYYYFWEPRKKKQPVWLAKLCILARISEMDHRIWNIFFLGYFL